jgi:hypothetical protein
VWSYSWSYFSGGHRRHFYDIAPARLARWSGPFPESGTGANICPMAEYETLAAKIAKLSRAAARTEHDTREFAIALAKGFVGHLGAPRDSFEFRSLDDDQPVQGPDISAACRFDNEGWYEIGFAITFRENFQTPPTRVDFTFSVARFEGDWQARAYPGAPEKRVDAVPGSAATNDFYSGAVNALNNVMLPQLMPWSPNRGIIRVEA